MCSSIVYFWTKKFWNLNTEVQFKNNEFLIEAQSEYNPALADISRSALCC